MGYFSEVGFTSYSCKLCSSYSSKNAQYICYSFNLSFLQSNFSTVKVFSGFEGLLYGFIYKSRQITLLFWKKRHLFNDTYRCSVHYTKIWSCFPLTISVNGTKSTVDLIAFTEEIFNGKIHFWAVIFASYSILYHSIYICS